MDIGPVWSRLDPLIQSLYRLVVLANVSLSPISWFIAERTVDGNSGEGRFQKQTEWEASTKACMIMTLS